MRYMKERTVEKIYTQAGELEIEELASPKPKRTSQEEEEPLDADALEDEIGITYGTNPQKPASPSQE